eukprot:5801757-Pyramimonas_sp.AAC.2
MSGEGEVSEWARGEIATAIHTDAAYYYRSLPDGCWQRSRILHVELNQLHVFHFGTRAHQPHQSHTVIWDLSNLVLDIIPKQNVYQTTSDDPAAQHLHRVKKPTGHHGTFPFTVISVFPIEDVLWRLGYAPHACPYLHLNTYPSIEWSKWRANRWNGHRR